MTKLKRVFFEDVDGDTMYGDVEIELEINEVTLLVNFNTEEMKISFKHNGTSEELETVKNKILELNNAELIIDYVDLFASN